MGPYRNITGHPNERVEVDLSPSAAIAFLCASALICFILLLSYCRCYCNEADGVQLMRLLRRRKPASSPSLPVVFYRRKYEEELAPMACVVCLGDFEEREAVKVIPGCGHVFHAPCIDRWLVLQASCPVCRSCKLSGSRDEGARTPLKPRRNHSLHLSPPSKIESSLRELREAMERESGTPRSARARRSFRLRCPSLNTVRLRRVFDIFDQDCDGLITILELSLALDRLGLGADRDELASTVASFIRPDRDGLEFEDFEALHRELGDSLFGGAIDEGAVEEEEDAEGDMEEAFRVFDEDGDGFISAKELHTVLKKLGLETSMAKVHDMIHSVDVNHDGRVDFWEFKNMMVGVSVLGV